MSDELEALAVTVAEMTRLTNEFSENSVGLRSSARAVARKQRSINDQTQRGNPDD